MASRNLTSATTSHHNDIRHNDTHRSYKTYDTQLNDKRCLLLVCS